MPTEQKPQKEFWKRYSRERREALRSVDVVQISVSIPSESKDKVLALLQPYTDRVRLLAMLVGATSYDRTLAIGLLQSVPGALTIEEVESILRYRLERVGESSVRQIVARHGLPQALAEPQDTGR